MGMAALFGNGTVFDAFSVAFRLPNLARRLFGEGALTAAFLPALVRQREQHGAEAGWRLAGAVLTGLGGLLLAITVLLEILLWSVLQFAPLNDDWRLLLVLSAELLPYVVVICLAAQASVMLHSCNHFTWPAVLPVLLNVVWIAALVAAPGWSSNPDTQIHLICAAILVAGLLQCLVPLPQLYQFGFRFHHFWKGPFRSQVDESLRDIRRSLLAVLFGLSVSQINILADGLFAWGLAIPEAPARLEWWHILESGTASALYLGQRLYQFPLGVFGLALGTVMFPLLARHAESGAMKELRDDLLLGLRLVIVVGLPSAAGLVLLSRPLSVVLFQHGEFTVEDSAQTARMIAACGVGVWAGIGLLIVNRCCYAVGDRQTPLRIGIASVVLNLLLNVLLLPLVGGPGLAIATSITTTIQCLVTVAVLQRRIGSINWSRLQQTLNRTAIATGLMTLTCLASAALVEWLNAQQAVPQLPDTGSSTSLYRLATLIVPFVSGTTVFLVSGYLLGLTELTLLLSRTRRDTLEADQPDEM